MKNHVKVKDKEILIIGSWRPWLEIIALVNGAKEVTSTDYQKIYCDRPNLKLMTTYEFNDKYLKGELPQYDIVISISSVEHSGLGRLYYLRAQSFTSLMADLSQDKIRVSSFIRCLNGTFP